MKFMHASDIKRIERQAREKEKGKKIKERRENNERYVVDGDGLLVPYERWLEGKKEEDCWKITK